MSDTCGHRRKTAVTDFVTKPNAELEILGDTSNSFMPCSWYRAMLQNLTVLAKRSGWHTAPREMYQAYASYQNSAVRLGG